jgi:glycosyltransferase involved in cell wall biosynthesis
LAELACAQNRRDQRVAVVSDATPDGAYASYPRWVEMIHEAGIPTLQVDSTFRRVHSLNLAAALRVRALIEELQPDVIHAHAAIPALVGLIATASLRKRLPVLMSMQGWGTNKTREQHETDVAIMNLVAAVAPVSHASAALLRRLGVTNPNLVVIPNAVGRSPKRLQAIPDDHCWRWLIDQAAAGRPIVGCIGTVSARKNQSCLLHALALLPEPRPACILVGEDEQAGECSRLIAELGLRESVYVAGYRGDAVHIMQRLRVLVLPSRSEGLPLALLEAFRERVPVIGSDIPEISELIEHDVNGMRFRTDDAYELAHAIKRLLGDPERAGRFAESAFSRYQQDYTFEAMDSRYLDLYGSLVLKRSLGD